jgi:AcrR family transcriptional regulator
MPSPFDSKPAAGLPAEVAPEVPPEAPPEGPRWQRRADARPAELLAAALDLFVERGYANARLEDVAARAGVSKGTLYLYYANKEELFKAVVRAGLVSPLVEAREVIARFPGTSSELLGLVVKGWWERIGKTALAGIPKLIMAEARNFPEIARFYFDEVVQPGQATMAAVIARGIERGEFRKVNPMHAAHLLTAPFLLIGSWRTSMIDPAMTGPDDPRFLDAPALLALHLEMLERGLAPEDAQENSPADKPAKTKAARRATPKETSKAEVSKTAPAKSKKAATGTTTGGKTHRSTSGKAPAQQPARGKSRGKS